MSRVYTLVPLPVGEFSGVDPVSRLIFGEIYSRYRLSCYNVTGAAGDSPFYDYDRDEVICYYSHAELSQVTGVSERTVRRSLDALQSKGLIDWKKTGLRACNQYYIPDHIRNSLRSDQSGQIDRPTRSE